MKPPRQRVVNLVTELVRRKADARDGQVRVSFPHSDQTQPGDRFAHTHLAAGGQ
jgi:hypothetical protein